jgi:hypothetical protein
MISLVATIRFRVVVGHCHNDSVGRGVKDLRVVVFQNVAVDIDLVLFSEARSPIFG